MITGRFTLYELVLILLWIATTIRMYVGHRMHTKQIGDLQKMHPTEDGQHPPEPSPGEVSLPSHVGKSSSQLLRGERGAVNVLYVLLCALVLIVILVLLGFHPTL
ncbi:MAG: hypothetical protein WBF51_04150 [Candidatus Dormiibacterota bacterium]